MAKTILAEIKDMSREDRAKYFHEHKSEILGLNELDSVNGGLTGGNAGGNTEENNVKNPGSAEIPYKGNWWSSYGFVCDGKEIC